MTKIIRTNKVEECDPSSLADLPAVLTNWSQAASNFHMLYGVLRETIAANQKADRLAENQFSLAELEQIRETILQELNSLVNAMDTPTGLNQESNPAMIDNLRLHTVRLQKQTKRIQRALWLSSLGAS